MSIIVGNWIDCINFITDEIKLIVTKSCFIDEKVGEFLSMVDGFSWVINMISFGILHAELNSIYTISNTKPWVHNTFNNSYCFFILIILIWVIKRWNWYENWTKCFMLKDKFVHTHANFAVSKKLYFIKCVFKVFFVVFIKNVCVFRFMC